MTTSYWLSEPTQPFPSVTVDDPDVVVPVVDEWVGGGHGGTSVLAGAFPGAYPRRLRVPGSR